MGCFRNIVSVALLACCLLESYAILQIAVPKMSHRKSQGRVRGARGSSGDERERTNRTMVEGSCTGHVRAPGGRFTVRCPSSCPLRRFDREEMCHWNCITESACNELASSTVDSDTGTCAACTVPACADCKTAYTCATCSAGFELVDGQCLSVVRHRWQALFVVLGIVVVFIMIYLILIPLRPIVSEERMERALDYRSKAKAREDDQDHSPVPIFLNLCNNLTSSGGLGTLLHFRWQLGVIIWSTVVLLLIGGASWWHGHLSFAEIWKPVPSHDESYHECSAREPIHERDHAPFRQTFLIITGIVYTFTFVAAVLFAIHQRRTYQKFEETTTDMEDYALLCEGFPIEKEDGAPGSLPEDYKNFLASTWGSSVLGVSVVWDYDAQSEDVNALVNGIVYNLDEAFTSNKPLTYDVGPTLSEMPQGLPHESESKARSCPDPYMRDVDKLWWSDTLQIAELVDELGSRSPRAALHGQEKVKEFVADTLKELSTTGYVYVIFHTERDRNAALETPLPKFRGECEIRTAHPQGDAETVMWDTFMITSSERILRIFYGVLGMFAVLLFWTICFYLPWAVYIFSWSTIGGASQGRAGQGTVLALLITAGNQIAYAAAGIIAEKIRFRCRDDRDKCATALYTLAVLINTVLDMWLVMLMAHGWQLDQKTNHEAVVRNPGIQHAVFMQLMFYLWPGSLLLPFLLEPLVIGVAPYYLGKWFVRSKEGIHQIDADVCLAPPPFDLNRYGDLLINVTLVALCFFLTEVNLWWIFLMLVISNIFIIAWDDYRFKRVAQRTHFSTQQIDISAHYMGIFPCAIMGSAFMFKCLGGQGLADAFDSQDQTSQVPFIGDMHVWGAVAAAFALHCLVHTFTLYYICPMFDRPDDEETPVRYEITAQRICCNWFNANPVHCLRSMYIHQHDPPHIYFVPGKEFVHRRNTTAGDASAMIIYEASNFEEDISLVKTISGVAEDMEEELFEVPLALYRAATSDRTAAPPPASNDTSSA